MPKLNSNFLTPTTARTVAHCAKLSFVFLIEEYVFCAIYVTRHEGFGIDFTNIIDESSMTLDVKTYDFVNFRFS